MHGIRSRWAMVAVLAAACASPAPPPVIAVVETTPPPAPAPVVSARPPVPEPAAPPEEAPSAPAAPPGGEAAASAGAGSPEAPPASAGRGWLGVELEPAGTGESGVRIARVVPKSPADRDGLMAGDLVVRLDSQAVTAPPDIVGVVSNRAAGTRVGVSLKRQGQDRLVAVTLGAYPERDQLYRMSFVDQPAPAFELLQTAKGSLAPTLAAQRGRVVVVEFWAPWCAACRALIPHMNQLHAQYAARGLRVIGITNETVARAAAAAAQLGMEFPVASDESGKTSRAYEARAIPAVFVIDRSGTVRDVMVGYDGPRLARLDALVQRLVAEP